MQTQPQQLFDLLFRLLSALSNPIISIPAIISIIYCVCKTIQKSKKYKEYKNSTYYQVTKLPYTSIKNDRGKYGEYLTFKHLKHFETNGARFLFNIYIPKAENGKTTEIDVLMICSKGIFVFESKNYSGWIFGSESQKIWYQTLPKNNGDSHKKQFYNPIMQNHSHLKYLETFLGKKIPMHSIIVFSDRCTLKNVQISTNDIRVIKRNNVASVVSGICNQIPNDILTNQDISEIYNKLYPYTQVDEFTKSQHSVNIHNKLNPQPTRVIIQDCIETATEQPNAIVINTPTITDKTQISETTESTMHTAKTSALKCPKCNGTLILRTASKGTNAGNKFYGCSNYPKCKYIQNIVNKTDNKML